MLILLKYLFKDSMIFNKCSEPGIGFDVTENSASISTGEMGRSMSLN